MKTTVTMLLITATAGSGLFACDSEESDSDVAIGGAGASSANSNGNSGATSNSNGGSNNPSLTSSGGSNSTTETSTSPMGSGGSWGTNSSNGSVADSTSMSSGGTTSTLMAGTGAPGSSGMVSGNQTGGGNATGFSAGVTLPGATIQLSDAQVMHVANTLNSGEITEAQQASERAQSASVRQFADQMIADHTAARQKTEALAAAQQVVPADNTVSGALRDHVQQTTMQLNNAADTSYDRAYMSDQVVMHQQAIKLIDETLLPSAESAELDAVLNEMRNAVVVHLAQAEAILKTLP